MTRFAFRVKRRGPEYKVEDWSCSKHTKSLGEGVRKRGVEIKEMGERDHLIFTRALALKKGRYLRRFRHRMK
jgi:hypothetical protein